MRLPFKLRQKSKPRETIESTFQSVIKKAIEENGGTVNVFRYDPENPSGSFATRVTPFDSDVVDWKERDVPAYLNQVHGGGRYRVQVNYRRKDDSMVEAKTFDYAIGGDPKEGYYESKKSKQAEQQRELDVIKMSMDFADKMRHGDNGSAELVKTLMTLNADLQKQNSQNMLDLQKHNDTMMMEMQKRNDALMMELRRDKDSGGDMNGMIETMMHMEEFKSMLQPKVEQNETIELVRAVAPAISALLAGRMGLPGLPQQEPMTMIEARPPGAGDENLGSPSPQAHETPSGSIKEATPSIELEKPEIQLPNGTKIKTDEFRNVVLVPLFDQINSGVSPYEIAIFIKTILDFTMLRMKSNIEPHPALFGMVKALVDASQGNLDLKSIEKAYMDFASDIEMPKEIIDPVKQELIKIYMPTFLAMQNQSADSADEEEEDAGQAE